MGSVCYLCDRKASRNDNISLHCFPKNPSLRQRWKQACELNEKDDVSRIKICSAHFSADNLEKVNGLQQSRICLKIGAVPSISVPVTTLTPPALSHNMQNNINDRSVEVAMEIGATQSAKNCGSCLTKIAVNGDENMSHPTSSELHTPQKRRFAEPRFIGDISTSDFSTPEKARRVLRLVKETDKKKSKTITNLRSKLLYFKKRIVDLQNLVQHLIDKGLIPEESGDNL